MSSPVFIAPDGFADLRAAAVSARQRLAGEAATPVAHRRLDTLVDRFGLSGFERDILLLAAGLEIDDALAPILQKLNPDGTAALSFSAPMAALEEAHWSALSPERPLRHWGLVDMSLERPLARAGLVINERILHHLVGLDPLDVRVAPYVTAVPASDWMPDGVHQLAEQAARALSAIECPLVEVEADDPRDIKAVGARAARLSGAGLWELHSADLPTTPDARVSLARLWQREAMLAGRVLLIEAPDRACWPMIQTAPRVIASGLGEAALKTTRPREKLVLSALAPKEQAIVWRTRLGAAALKANGALDRVTDHFTLGLSDTEAAAATARRKLGPDSDTARVLWDAARSVARPRLRDLATEMRAKAYLDDLILPERERDTLRAITAQVRQRRKVYEDWGFSQGGARGQGVAVLFSGPSGTGKTLAAEVLATELELDLFRIDLSRVVSKFIGETEKNLAAVFDAAEDGGSILLFDEADALFGKRSEVKDSHDRYANMEISFLLQRMEAYRGLAILTTNFRAALDKAFARRLRFIVEFPFPGFEERLAIWSRIFPVEAQTDGIDPARLAQLGVAGGAIRNIALNAAFLAVEEQGPITMAHLARAAETECAKIDKKIASAETRGWA